MEHQIGLEPTKPSRWQRDALPIELLVQNYILFLTIILIVDFTYPMGRIEQNPLLNIKLLSRLRVSSPLF
jgi:hypothetical protein